MFAGGNGNFTATRLEAMVNHQGLSPLPREWRSQQIRYIDISEALGAHSSMPASIVRAELDGPPPSNPVARRSGRASMRFSAEPFLTSRNPDVSHGTVMSGTRARLPVRTGCEQSRRSSRCPRELVKHILISICIRMRSACLPVPDINP